MKRRNLLTGAGGAVLLTALSAPVTASGHTNSPSSELDNVDPRELPAFAGGRKHGVVTATETVPDLGTFSVEFDCDTGEVTITNPDGSVTTRHAAELATEFQSMAKNGIPKDLPTSSPPISTQVSKSDVCPYFVSLVGTSHALVWARALALIAVNPAIGVLVALGQGAFYTWVSTHC